MRPGRTKSGSPDGRPGAPEPGGCADGVRCGCGSLLARLVEGGVEIKCRRCKQVRIIALQR